MRRLHLSKARNPVARRQSQRGLDSELEKSVRTLNPIERLTIAVTIRGFATEAQALAESSEWQPKPKLSAEIKKSYPGIENWSQGQLHNLAYICRRWSRQLIADARQRFRSSGAFPVAPFILN